MKKTFFKFGLLALGLTTAVFNSCNKDDDDNSGNGGNASKITATNVINGSTRITTVKALAYWESSNYDYGNDAIAQAPYKNNGFTLELPENVSSKYLDLLSEDAPSGVSISDENAKIFFLDDIRGYDEDENEIGDFYLEEENDDSEYYTSWMYADRDVTIKGEDDGDKYDVNLKKGWNIIYESYTENSGSLTSKKPSGVNYSWNFYSNSDYRSVIATRNSVENKKSVFSKLQEDRKNRTRKK